MQMVIVSLCSIALVISILKPRKKAANALRAAGGAAVLVGAMTQRVGTVTQVGDVRETEIQPLYHSDSDADVRVEDLEDDLKKSEKGPRGAGEMV